MEIGTTLVADPESCELWSQVKVRSTTLRVFPSHEQRRAGR